jgi:hypothetical protein
MTRFEKRNILFFISLVMIVTILIAIGLPNLELQPGIPLPSFENGQVGGVPFKEEAGSVVTINEFVKQFLIFLLVVSVFYLIFRIIKGVPDEKLSILLKSFLL